MIDRPKNSKALLIIIAVLLVANIGGWVFFFKNTPSGKKPSYSAQRKNLMQAYLKNEIAFSEAQLVQYDSLSERHQREMQPMFDLLKKEKEERVKYISQNAFADTAIAEAVSNTTAKQQLVETKMLMHLKDVRNICTEQQKIKFDSSVYKMFARRSGDKKKKD